MSSLIERDNQELLDLVDAADVVVGTILRGDFDDAMANPPGYIRAADLFVFNTRGQLLVPTRSLHKRLQPGGLDFSCAEHVLSGESYEAAVRRGALEELGLKLDMTRLKHLKLVAATPDLPIFDNLYEYTVDDSFTPRLGEGEFSGFRWMYAGELAQVLASGVVAKPSLLRALSYLQ